jgi:hypothetical protein
MFVECREKNPEERAWTNMIQIVCVDLERLGYATKILRHGDKSLDRYINTVHSE